MFHADAIRKEPEFAVANVVIINVGSSDIHKIILIWKTKRHNGILLPMPLSKSSATRYNAFF
jgi:hypothetical protein